MIIRNRDAEDEIRMIPIRIPPLAKELAACILMDDKAAISALHDLLIETGMDSRSLVLRDLYRGESSTYFDVWMRCFISVWEWYDPNNLIFY